MHHDNSFEERQTAAGLVIAIAAIVAYVAVITVRAITDDRPLTAVAWQGPLLACIGAGALLYAALYVSMRIRLRGQPVTDERDDRIRAIGEEAGASMTGLAVVIALVLLALDVDTFWVANTLLLLSFAGAVIQAGTVLGAYRGGVA